MLTRELARKQLDGLCIPEGSNIIAHFAFKQIGETEGGIEGLIEILSEYFTEKDCIFCIPTHTWTNMGDLSKPVLDLTSDFSCIGAVPTVAARVAKYRTINPTHSMAVFGEDNKAETFMHLDDNIESGVDVNGCHGQFGKPNGYIMLIGVDQKNNTFMHCVEEAIGVGNRMTDFKPTKVKLRDGSIIDRPVKCVRPKDIGDVSHRFPKYEPAFRYYGAIKDGRLGNAAVQLCKGDKITEVMKLVRERSGGIELLADDTPLDESYYK